MKEENDNIEQFFKKRLTKQEFDFDEAMWDNLEARLDQQDGIARGADSSDDDDYDGMLIFRAVGLLFIIASIAFFLGWYLRGTDLIVSEQKSENEKIKLNDQAVKKNKESINNEIDQGDILNILENENAEITVSKEENKKEESIKSEKKFNKSDKQRSNEKEKSDFNSSDKSKINSDRGEISLKIGSKSNNNVLLNVEDKDLDSDKRDDTNEKKEINISSDKNENIDKAKVEITSDNGGNKNNNKTEETSSNEGAGSGKKILLNTIEDDSKEQGNDGSKTVLNSNKKNTQLNLNLLGFKKVNVEFNKPNSLLSIADFESIVNTDSLNIDSAQQKGKWAINLFAAPDFNSTDFSELFNNFGQSVGLTFEYFISPRIKIETGAVINNKAYLANGEDYTPKKGFWTYGIAPEETDAKCLVLDIPINFGYRLTNNTRHNLWVNAGVSSYWMLTEEYRYIYDNPNPDLIKWWRGEKENYHFFGALNLSINYQKSLNDKLSFMVNPYFKTPLKGIGHGAVNLLSSGINIGIQYRPMKRNKSKKE